MGKDKLRKFAENETFHNVFQPATDTVMGEDFSLKGKWNSEVFKNNNPITLELACGKGEYSIALADMYPDRNFIGVDIKGARIWRGAKTAVESEMNNVAFLRTRLEFVLSCFEENEVDEIWILFPDPQKHKSRIKKRLTHPEFLNRYRHIMKSSGTINLKSDSSSLYDFTLDMIIQENLKLNVQSIDIYDLGKEKFSDELNEILSVKTYYEQRWLKEGKKIKYLNFNL